MPKTHLEGDKAHVQRIFHYVEAPLEDDLSLDKLSAIAASFKDRLHRQFIATFEMPVHRFIQFACMKHASYRPTFREGETVTKIAMDASM